MSVKTYSGMIHGITAQQIEVEIEHTAGLPTFVLIGLPSQAIDEAKERITAALLACKIPLKAKRTVVNLAPADLKKTSSCLELAIAVGLLQLYGVLSAPEKRTVFIGELSLDGSLKAVRGALPIVLAARDWGYQEVVVPAENSPELACVSGITIKVVTELQEIIAAAQDGEPLTQLRPVRFAAEQTQTDSLAGIAGQEQAKRALTIAAAGGHNLHFSGPPGAGKSILAQAITGLLPPLSEAEAIELTSIHSLAGAALSEGMVRARPFIAPHHTATRAGLLGGGNPLTPGAISLAHRGVLFLDEFPEFSRSLIESLRQPLETKTIAVTRANGTVVLPADFTLITAANPCPCGFWGSQTRVCSCNEHIRLTYQSKLSGPIMDRIDMKVRVAATELQQLSVYSLPPGTQSEALSVAAQAVRQARQLQLERLEASNYQTTSQLKSTAAVFQFCQLTPKAAARALTLAEKKQLSPRGYLKLLKVARTIADLEQAVQITDEAVQEAAEFS